MKTGPDFLALSGWGLNLKMVWRHKLLLTSVLLAIFAVWQAIHQIQEDSRLRQIAESIVSQAGAATQQQKAVALRDFLRKNVTYQGVSIAGRPFLRATALETINSGKGYCGEVTRAFIGLARTVGVQAQRINLYGKENHVVAVADLGDGESTIIDCQHPAHIVELQTLDKVMLMPEFSDYSTFNFRRIGLGWLFPRLKVNIGWLTYLTENPYTINACLSLLLIAVLWSLPLSRFAVSWILQKRGWVHRSSLPPNTMPSPQTC